MYNRSGVISKWVGLILTYVKVSETEPFRKSEAV
jgi:hypothetical protein